MQKDPYLVLGLEEGASESEVREAYARLKDRYSADRFLEGEVGMEATKKLSEIELAYSECIDDLERKQQLENFGTRFVDVEKSVKDGNYDDAQRQLDNIDVRDAEWHYYQAMVYFKKGWHTESKKQLEICIALEPYNAKYSGALDKMSKYIDDTANGKLSGADNVAGGQQRAGYSEPNYGNAEAGANACCDTCCLAMCCDSCCECMGGDCIPCC
ncbi:MAG: hypothetical protein HFK07_05945 [Clostridia bacterium]|jgi:molecular chaperone DnaJ|nr:hypothetical protein [Clostridia bacterium]MCX4366903.1 hypothetical protein [Clostridia bacterium]